MVGVKFAPFTCSNPISKDYDGNGFNILPSANGKRNNNIALLQVDVFLNAELQVFAVLWILNSILDGFH